MKRTDKNKAYYRLDAEQKIRKESVDFAIRIMRIIPHACKKPITVLDFAYLVQGFIQDTLREDINKLPSDIVEGLRNKYGGDNDPYEDLT
jgi:hypothetical protein